MSAPRTALRTLLSRRATPAQIRTFARTSARRNAAHESYTKSSKPPSSDLPWIIGSVGVTIPAAFYLVSSPSGGPHDVKHDAHAAKESAKSAASSAASSASSAVDSVKSTASEITHSSAPVSKAKDIASSAASSAKAAAGSAVESVKSHIPSTSATTSTTSSTVDAVKEKAGAAVETVKEKAEDLKDYVVVGHKEMDPAKRDPGHSVKEPAGLGSMSQKQEGLSNTDTKHVVFNTPRGDAIKKKSEGSHDSAKLKGTVDSNRDAVGPVKKEKPAGAVQGEGESEKKADQ